MSFLILLAVGLNLWALRVVIKAEDNNDILAWSIIFFLLLWVIAPGVSVLYLEHFCKSQWVNLTPEYVELYLIEGCLVFLAIMISVKTGKKYRTIKNPIVNYKAFYFLAGIYCCWIIFTIFSQDVNYLENNDLSKAIESRWTGAITLCYIFLGLFFTYSAMKARESFIRLLSAGLILLTTVQMTLTGGRMSLLWLVFILVFWLRETVRARLVRMTFIRSILHFTFLTVLLIPLLALAVLIGEMRAERTVDEMSVETLRFDMTEGVLTLYSKVNAIDTGLSLIQGYGAGTAGHAPYVGAALFFLPRFVYPDKPVAGSVDGSYAGMPSRLVPALVNESDTINNVGVSPLAICIWHWGWIGGMSAFLISGIVNLRLLGYLFRSNYLVLRLLGLWFVPVPGFLHVIPSSDVALKHFTLVAFALVILWVWRQMLRKGGSKKRLNIITKANEKPIYRGHSDQYLETR